MLRPPVQWVRRHIPRLAPLLDRHSQEPVVARLARTICSPRQLREVAYATLLRDEDTVELRFRRGELVWTVDAGDAVGRGLFVDGRYEVEAAEALITWVEQHARPRVLVDVGANVGSTTIPFAMAGFDVIAVEPVPSTFAMLDANVRQNGLGNRVVCMQQAVTSSGAGTAEMWISGASGLNELFVEGRRPVFTRTGRAPVELVSVRGNGLTEIVAEAGRTPADVGLVWCDAQGSESNVIETGAPLWRSGVPLVVEIDVDILDGHGGVPRFLRLAREHFTWFVPAHELATADDTRPIGELEDFVRSIGAHRSANALLIP
jgi:FkbM family methyltransferase